MIAIKPTKLKDFSSLMQLDVQEEQKGFFTPFEMAYQKRSKSEAFFTIYSDDLLVGYLVIDKGFSQHAPFAKRYELELKYLMIDQRFQRQGVGSEALRKLFLYAYTINPKSTSLCSTVPQSQQYAMSFLDACGFINTEETTLGDNEKEWILRHPLS
ncbi:GNAT family N-acetyltransferase [Vibrio alginolyticus]|uniref:GNAT family N-acetyltransferase n=1 Tax=Vibrio TaxID=662 RepID=UPI0006A58794|nr:MULTISPECIES: GNAT family N-acetyltransferase [Vibrio]EGQ7649719.1 GNAT family N-acetyltransferase [Vibrio alginolyticus]EGR0268459.1 GNAT family N-acetyltransferase [Vibrio alginolyticus]EKM3678354.1 GNAT family N-acetyltransferase [Vibrio alginolyticus]EKZ8661107.1 GNAT family N-acetyltransferase [Vibrio alginolyticus]ELA8173566.1 GNAT family N-acetyltransferase [Vibrio alginolyticus]